MVGLGIIRQIIWDYYSLRITPIYVYVIIGWFGDRVSNYMGLFVRFGDRVFFFIRRGSVCGLWVLSDDGEQSVYNKGRTSHKKDVQQG